MNNLEIKLASRNDLRGIQLLLKKFNLPAEDVTDHFPNFFVAKQENEILGVIGLEMYGTSALLRSLAVAETRRNKGIAKSLYDRLVVFARTKGIREFSLLTTTAEGYFKCLGFEKVPREEAPEYVKQSKGYKICCPSTAICMRRAL